MIAIPRVARDDPTLLFGGVRDAAHQGEQLIAIERLAEVSVRASAALELVGRNLVVRRNEHHGNRGARCEEAVVEVESSHAPEMDVEHETGRLAVERRAEVLMGARVRLDGDAGGSQHSGER